MIVFSIATNSRLSRRFAFNAKFCASIVFVAYQSEQSTKMLRQLSFHNVIREEQERIDRWFSFLKSFFIYCACLFASALCLLAMAIAIYAFIYYLFVPKIEHSFPVYLDYGDTTVTSDSRNSGPAVVAKIPLTARHTQYTKTKLAVSDSTTAQLLQAGQAYTIILEMIVPESPKNINLGPVMLETRLYGRSFSREDGARCKTSVVC